MFYLVVFSRTKDFSLKFGERYFKDYDSLYAYAEDLKFTLCHAGEWFVITGWAVSTKEMIYADSNFSNDDDREEACGLEN